MFINTIDAVIYTLKDISQFCFAENFFTNLELLSVQPDVISLTEQKREPYIKEKAIEYWTKEEGGCWDEEREKFIGKAGGIFAKNKKDSITYAVYWSKCEDMKKVNTITFSILSSKYKKLHDVILKLFIETVYATEAFYGYVAHSDTIKRQHATGSVITRIPGMFWCNYFGKIYIDFFGKDKFSESHWYKIESNNDNGMFLFLDEKPDGNLLEDNTIEENSKKYLGYDSFANKQEEDIEKLDIVRWLNKDPVQYKKVPKLF